MDMRILCSFLKAETASSDAVPRNVLMDIQGNLYFIDLQINNPKRLYQYLADFRKFKEARFISNTME